MVNCRPIYLALLMALCLLIPACSVGSGAAVSDPQSAPFGPNVYVFGPRSKKMQETISRIYAAQMDEHSEFGDARYAILFQPGHYDLDVRVGYYTQVSGLGVSPDDVTIKGAIRTQDNPATKPIYGGPGAVDNFWRSAENLSIIPTLGSLTVGAPSTTPRVPGGVPANQNVWAVSQGAPLRRIHIKSSPIRLSATECTNANAYAPKGKRDTLNETCPTTLRLFDVGWSSGGFMADSKIDGLVESGSQQQWFSRNCAWTRWNTEHWNMVFLGSSPVPAGLWPGTHDSDGAITDAGRTPVIREKPFLSVDTDGRYFVMVPPLKHDTLGVDWDGRTPPARKIPIAEFYIVKPQPNRARTIIDAASINAALRNGKHLLFSPGVYYLNDTIQIREAGTVVLGLGSATLVANNGLPAMVISDVDGVTLAGIIFDAGLLNSTTLLQVGEPGSSSDHAANPTVLFDVFCRVGGPQYGGKASSCVTINSNDVVGDNLWLWRADHGSNVGWTSNTADNGLVVNGAHVTMYGLAVEHFQKYQTVWNGNSGRVYFYQSEMPYDPPRQGDWMNSASVNPSGYASYKVGDKVTEHHAWGVGVYCYFKNAAISAYHAVEVPSAVENSFEHLVTIWLNGHRGSEITHIIDNEGAAVTARSRRATLP